MTDEQQGWIDRATYQEVLGRWRFAPVGDPIFQGDTGKYYGKKMAERKSEVGQGEHVRASKAIGWESRFPEPSAAEGEE